MVYDVLLEGVAYLVDEVNMHVGVVRIDLATALVDGQEDGFDTTRGLRHQTRRTRGGYRQTGNVASTVFHHVGIQGLVGLFDALDERVVLLALGVVNGKGTALTRHLHAGAVGIQRQRLVHLHAEVGSLLRAIAQSHGGNHVTLGSDAYTRSAPHATLLLDLFPEVHLGTFDLHRLRVAFYLLHDQVYLLQFQVDDVVHQSLGLLHMLLEQLIVEIGVLLEGILHIGIEVDAQQSAGVVGTEGNLTARIGADRTESQVGIAVGNTLAKDGVPEQHAGLGTFPGVVHDFLPESLGGDFLFHLRMVSCYGELLHVGLVLRSTAHELVVYLHADIGTGHLALRHLGVDKRLSLRMLNAHAEHERTASAVLCHLARTITISLHEGHESRRGQRRVVHRLSLRTDMAQVVPYSTATLHQLHLLLVDAQDGAVAVGITIQTDDKAVRQRRNLVVVADARHRTACRHDIAEVVQQVENLLGRHRVLVFLFYPCYLVGDTPMHLFGRLLVDIAIGVFHGIFVHPHTGSQFVTLEISQRGLESLIIRVFLFCFHISVSTFNVCKGTKKISISGNFHAHFYGKE